LRPATGFGRKLRQLIFFRACSKAARISGGNSSSEW
jgi:hypothetical protein